LNSRGFSHAPVAEDAAKLNRKLAGFATGG
jgi:hypothetical protein